MQFPEEGYFVKSPKSFFGATGLKQGQINFFEDIATAMILKIKQRAESSLGYTLSQTVIGRPVNFQAVGGEQSNQQAVGILTRISALPFNGMILAHSNESEWQTFKNNQPQVHTGECSH